MPLPTIAASLARLELIEEWRYLPPETSPSDQLIALTSSVARHSNAGIYAADLLASSILHLSLDGSFIQRIGRRGEGPGEFRSPTVVRATDNGLAVLDRSGRIGFFDTMGLVTRIVRLQPAPTSQRDFIVLNSGNLVITGTVVMSDHSIHVYDSDGQYLRGLGQLRTDLDDPVLQMRYSDGFVVESGDGLLAYARRVPMIFTLFGQSSVLHSVIHDDIIHDYVSEVAIPLEPSGWRFSWRHPGLSSFISLGDGCFLAAVGRIPDTVEGVLPEAEDFYSELVVLNARGTVLVRQTLPYYLRPNQAWRDSQDQFHILGIGRDKDTGLDFPIQYMLVQAARN